MTELRAAIDRERKIRHWTIPQLRDEFGADWPAAHANAVRAADNAVDGLFEQYQASQAALQRAHEEILFLCSDEDDIRKGLREQKEAADALLREAFELIWDEDAPYVEGGAKKLDDLAVKIGRYIGVDEERLTDPADLNPASEPKEDA